LNGSPGVSRRLPWFYTLPVRSSPLSHLCRFRKEADSDTSFHDEIENGCSKQLVNSNRGMKSPLIITAILAFQSLLALQAELIELEAVDGRKIKGEVLSHDAAIITVRRADGQSFQIPVASLTPATLEMVRGNMVKASPPEAAPPAASTSNADALVTINPAFRLEAKTLKAGRDTNVTWSTTWGSFNKESTTHRIIEITASTTARQIQQADLEVIFIWRDASTKRYDFTSSGKVKAQAQHGKPFIAAAEDQASDEHDRYAALGIEEKSGKRYAGWVARAIDAQGNIVAVVASLRTLEKFAHEVAFE
jgi:hypothetical protein